MRIEVDARGLNCPLPVIKTKKELENINDGIVVTIVDNEIAKENVLKLVNSMKCESKINQEENNYYIEITKGEFEELESMQEEITQKQEVDDNTVVFISSNVMGRGSDELGEILINGFIYTLSQTTPYPKSIIFVNSAVKLTTENENTIDNLKLLEEEGVEILSCGTCLDYLNLKNMLKVGQTSNMYDIVERLRNSSNTISI
ncbi:sulfurtransferase-like selenium metabolism protein YedF [Tepidibacter hydrothermalis]|uniref:Sulfurtransferase-like selenium metabolism protein YedF n=1 Tax=Tepidibacter hydrothermalis TaxID=3036126 RepID=A0ABY8EHP0_9FIRM|nr:sulfurtransferase-like selenium metabolism protein YedF [Tepidibacter hydrothermalis]WFD10273.1 sulfurtransferase-like selenium metabolism protein YedF [Tepidibacter hydrothermalis]